jgi:GNAT superfamily N-acetyltransferase
MTLPGSFSDLERTRLADFSEAHAYECLIGASGEKPSSMFSSTIVGGAIALRSSAVRSSVLFNRVIGLGLIEDATEAMLDELDAFYAVENVPWAIELSPAAGPAGLREWLRRRGFRRGLGTAMLVRACTEIPIGETDLRIECVRSSDAKLGAEIAAQIFRVNSDVQALLDRALEKPEYRQWLAYDGDLPVATCLSYVRGGVAWAGWSGTLASHRGRGVHGAFIAARLRDAAERGCQWLTVETALGTPESPDPAFRNLTRLGFSFAYPRHTYICVPRRKS